MALPKLNTLTYELTLPSTGEQLTYRPFLVKEQKALMIAQESENEKLIEKTLAQILNDCIIDKIDPYKLPMFDVEYIFLRIRGKSAGEKVTLNLLCPDDEKTRVDVEVDLEEIEVLMTKDHTNVIQLTDDISLIMSYPCLKDMMDIAGGIDPKIESFFTMIKRCIYEVHDSDTVHAKIDMSGKELDIFIESMSSKNLEDIATFFDTMPKLVHVIEVKNPKTKKKVEIEIEGLESFFE